MDREHFKCDCCEEIHNITEEHGASIWLEYQRICTRCEEECRIEKITAGYEDCYGEPLTEPCCLECEKIPAELSAVNALNPLFGYCFDCVE